MVFNKLTEQVKGKAEEAAAAGEEKIDAIIDEFNRMMPVAEELGLSISSFDIEAGLLPQIKASLVGSIEDIEDEAVEKLIAKHESNKLLVAIFKAVLMAKGIHQKLEGAYIDILKDLVIDVKLGIPPSISCRFK